MVTQFFEYGTQYQFHAKPRSNSMYYVAGTFGGVGLVAGLIATYLYCPELFKNISLPNFLKNINFSRLTTLISRTK